MRKWTIPILLALAAIASVARGGAPDVTALAAKFRDVCAKKTADANAAYFAAMAAYDKADKAGNAAEAQKHFDAAQEAMTIAGKDGWLFFAGEVRHVASSRFWGADAARVNRGGSEKLADPLPAILDYNEQCDKLGIKLIFLPVPPKAFIYPDKLLDGVPLDAAGVPPRLDVFHQEFYKLLRDKGVTVLDLTDEFLAARAKKPDGEGSERMCCMQDTHWSGSACVLAARKVASLVKNADWPAKFSHQKYEADWQSVEISGDLWRNLPKAKQPPREKLPLRLVGVKGAAGLTPVAPDANSPVILMGDSHTLVFNLGQELHATGAGLLDQLVHEFGVCIELVGTRGSGARPVRINLYRKQKALPNYLSGKKLLIWCLTARELTESPWGDVPITRN